MTFSIPAHKCGLVIGRGGENVKSINQQTGAFVEISRQPPPNGDPNFKLFTIRGSPQQIDHAKQLIEEKIEVRPSDPQSREEMHNSNSCQKGTTPSQLSFTFNDFFLCCPGSIVSSWGWWPWSRRPRWSNGSL